MTDKFDADTWELGKYQLRLNPVDGGAWNVTIYRQQIGWQIRHQSNSRENAMELGLDLIQQIESCNYFQQQTVIINGNKQPLRLMPQNSVLHMKIAAIQKHRGCSAEQARSEHHLWEVRNEEGDYIYEEHEMGLYFFYKKHLRVLPRAGTGA